MTPQNNPLVPATELKLTVTRIFQAPCALVYQAWTNPAQLSQWLNPKDAACRSVSTDLKVGGHYRITMDCGKGEHIASGEYLDIIPNQRLQFTWHWDHYPMPDSVITLTFEDLGTATRLTLVHAGLPDQEDVTEHSQGWNRLIEKQANLIEQNQFKTA